MLKMLSGLPESTLNCRVRYTQNSARASSKYSAEPIVPPMFSWTAELVRSIRSEEKFLVRARTMPIMAHIPAGSSSDQSGSWNSAFRGLPMSSSEVQDGIEALLSLAGPQDRTTKARETLDDSGACAYPEPVFGYLLQLSGLTGW
jgi:hypothetical protein